MSIFKKTCKDCATFGPCSKKGDYLHYYKCTCGNFVDKDLVIKLDNKPRGIYGKRIYTLDMYLCGYSFDEFKLRAKGSLLRNVLDLGNIDFISARFSELQLTPDEIRDELLKYRGTDGQYYCKGDRISSDKLNEWIRAYSRVIYLDGIVDVKEG